MIYLIQVQRNFIIFLPLRKWRQLPNILRYIISMHQVKKIALIHYQQRKKYLSTYLSHMIVVSQYPDLSIQPWKNQLKLSTMFSTIQSMTQLFYSVKNYQKQCMYNFRISSAIGFGVGVGANILTRFAVRISFITVNPFYVIDFQLRYSSKIYGLILINCVSRGIGWFEGFTLKVSSFLFFTNNPFYLILIPISGQRRICRNKHGLIPF